ncbi:MAG: fibronectin type III domain-containing protein [Candidatus Hatepunaea meridiana]|nr:fibronectin type III domain-containing protein [Candidatus Hatepunaea meridiana]
MYDRSFTPSANLLVFLLIMLIGIIGCSADSLTGPSGQSPADQNEIEDTKSSNSAVSSLNDEQSGVFIPPPSNLWAEVVTNSFDMSTSKIDLLWDDNSENELGFRIERRTGVEGVWQELNLVDRDVVSFQDRNLEPDKTYYYRVQAYGINTSHDYSNIATASTGNSNFKSKPSN